MRRNCGRDGELPAAGRSALSAPQADHHVDAGDFGALGRVGQGHDLELVGRGIGLIGVDYLSVEPFGSEDYATHHTLLGAGVVIVEGLDLRAVAPGEYEMACLPINIVGADGAPARVVLWTEN